MGTFENWFNNLKEKLTPADEHKDSSAEGGIPTEEDYEVADQVAMTEEEKNKRRQEQAEAAKKAEAQARELIDEADADEGEAQRRERAAEYYGGEPGSMTGKMRPLAAEITPGENDPSQERQVMSILKGFLENDPFSEYREKGITAATKVTAEAYNQFVNEKLDSTQGISEEFEKDLKKVIRSTYMKRFSTQESEQRDAVSVYEEELEKIDQKYAA